MKDTRRVLELQLTDNLLSLAKEFKGQPGKCAGLFNQSLLEDPAQSQDTDLTPPPPKP